MVMHNIGIKGLFSPDITAILVSLPVTVIFSALFNN